HRDEEARHEEAVDVHYPESLRGSGVELAAQGGQGEKEHGHVAGHGEHREHQERERRPLADAGPGRSCLRCGGGYGDGRRAVAGAHDASVRRAARSARAHHVSCVRKPSAAASLPAWSAGESLSAKASQKSGKLRTSRIVMVRSSTKTVRSCSTASTPPVRPP